MLITRVQCLESSDPDKFTGKRDPTIVACEALEGDEFKLWYRAWCCVTSEAYLDRLRFHLGWDKRKLSRELASLCEKGWAYRMVEPKPKTGRPSIWILPFGGPIPEGSRTKESLKFENLPVELQNACVPKTPAPEDETNMDYLSRPPKSRWQPNPPKKPRIAIGPA